MLGLAAPRWRTLLVAVLLASLSVACAPDQSASSSASPTPADPIGTALAQVPTLAPVAPASTSPTSSGQIVVGQQVWTLPATNVVLWTEPKGGIQVYERPQLYAGASVTVEELQAQATLVRTEEGVTGWIHTAANQALTAEPQSSPLAQALKPGTRVQVSAPNGVPLRSDARSTAPKIREIIPRGEQGVVQQQRGDWLEVKFDDQGAGWVRWYYAGTQHIDAVK